MIKAVIFDMDGTLIDTEKYYRICWPQALAHYGYSMTDEQALSLRSLGMPYAPQHLKEMFHDDHLDYEGIREYRTQLFNECIREHGIQLKPGVFELLTFLKEQNIETAIATATGIERTEKYLTDLHIQTCFRHIICAAMVQQGKPSPDIYQYACQQLALEPESCMAVEDSPNGVLSAYRAGCQVVMVPDQTQPDEELEKKLYAKVDRLSDIIRLLS